MKRIVAVLDSMWSWRDKHEPGTEAPRFFHINPRNLSGGRLYRMCGTDVALIVTNACRVVQSSARFHGVPDSYWLAENLRLVRPYDLLLVCGVVARNTYHTAIARDVSLITEPLIYMDHPASRRWSKITLDAMRDRIRKELQG